VPEILVGVRPEKLPADGTLVSKHVGVGTLCEVCFVTFFNLISAFCWFLKIWNHSTEFNA
jgi:hypothetical protein